MYPRPTFWRLAVIAAIFVVASLWLARGAIAGALYQRSLTAKTGWQLQNAIALLDWSLFFSESPDARFEKGVCLQLRGDFLASQREFDVLLATPIEDKARLSQLHNAVGVNQYSFSDAGAAEASHREALGLARIAGNRRFEAEAMIGLARVFYHSQGRFDDALANLREAKLIAGEISDPGIDAAATRNLGVVYWWFKAELERPLNEFYFPALELYRQQNDQRGAATMLTLIALVYNSKGDVYRFMQYQNESIEIQQRIGDEAGLADSYIAMGQLYDGIGSYRKAREFYSKGLSITARTGYRLAQTDLEALLAQVHVNLDEFDEAIKLFDPSNNRENQDSVQFNVTGVAYCYQLKGDYQRAFSIYDRALQAYRRANTATDIRFEANTLLRQAECSISLGDWQQATQLLEQAQSIFNRIETHSTGEIEPAIARASLATHLGKPDEALKYLRNALDVEGQIFAAAKTNFLIPPHRRTYDRLYTLLFDPSISSTGDDLTRSADELVFGFLENMRYRSLRNFLVRVREKRPVGAKADEAEKQLAQRIRTLSEVLKQDGSETVRDRLRATYQEFEELTLKAQLEQAQYVALREAKPVSISDLRSGIAPGTALVEYFFVGEKVYALVITQKNLQSVLLPISRSNLAAKAKVFRSAIFTDDGADWQPVSESLRLALIAPLESSGALGESRTIGFVPVGFLHDLPFAALARRENEVVTFLVEDYVLFQTPSATFYSHQAEQADDPLHAVRTAAFGRNDFSTENLSQLRFAADEAVAVAQITAGQAFTGDRANEAELRQLAHNAEYIHFSTHAVAEAEMPLLSRVLLAPAGTDDGSLTVREIFELGLKARLVTLSGCETGQSFAASGNESVEQDRIGLIEAFLHAGSRSVLASLLPVSDRPTTEFMKGFYSHLNKTDMARALALTQRDMISGHIALPDRDVRHPRYWSPFILVGSDR